MPGAMAAALLPLMVMAAPAPGAGYTYPIDIPAQPTGAALRELARETGIELLFDQALVRGLRSQRVRERLSVEAALQRILAGSNLLARRSATGAWVVERAGVPQTSSPDPPLPEILIVGLRTQNADIRRRENDVQPYTVATGAEILRAHRDDVGGYFRSRIPPNAEAAPPVDLKQVQDAAATNSKINLRGLGSDGTLILVDGRRLPNIPSERLGFIQPDLNSVPLGAIDRIETLTGTAGGIYGFGALGGVVNVILKRDYRGAEINLTTGISSRGDARRFRIEGRIGFTPDGGRTDVMIAASRSVAQPLLVGDRDDTVRNRTSVSLLAPDRLARNYGLSLAANSISVLSFVGDPLTFKPEYGGGALGAEITFLPINFSGSTTDLVTALTSRAGQFDLSLNRGEATSNLAPVATNTSVIVNIRHRFGGGVEGYFDALILRNHGKLVTHISNGILYFFPDSPRNPFEQIIWLTFPVPGETQVNETRFDSSRYTVGAIVNLPFGWKGTVEAIFGSMRYRWMRTETGRYSLPISDSEMGGDKGPDIIPFGNGKAFQDAVAAYVGSNAGGSTSRNIFREQSLRLAGPLLSMGGGDATLTLLTERRTERVPGYRSTGSSSLRPGELDDTTYAGNARATASLYAELHAPVFGDKAPVSFLRKFEIQLAVRYDRMAYDFTTADPIANAAVPSRSRFQAMAYTAGAKVFPTPWLMLRASYATGAQPPSLSDLIPFYLSTNFLSDPKRPVPFGEGADYIVGQGGAPDLRTVRARTLSLGAVINPFGDRGPRLSFDYSRIRRTRDVIFPLDQDVLDHEDLWPEKVVRAPLTDEDRALGYTGGAIRFLDARAINAGQLRVDTLDGRFDWTFPFARGKIDLYGAATVQLRNAQRQLFGKTVARVGYDTGPLRWRGNAGAQWTKGPLSVGANIQYYSRYRVYSYDYALIAPSYVELQGSNWVSPQAYLDLDISRRFRIPGRTRDREIVVALGVVNVFDHAPPRQVDFSMLGPQTSFYGDPRRRRFELSVSAGF